MGTTISEIAPDTFRLSVFAPQIKLQFNHFLIRDREPTLFHTGLRSMFPELLTAVKTLIDPSRLRWIGFSHFESDECGSLNQWLDAAPNARPVCTPLAAMLSVNDFASRPPRLLPEGELLDTGSHKLRLCSTAHLPHGWDASVMFDDTHRTLFCSDLFVHFGEVEALTEAGILGRARVALADMQKSPFAYSVPYTPQTDAILGRLADLKPATLAVMHGSSFRGDGARELRGLAGAFKELLSDPPAGR